MNYVQQNVDGISFREKDVWKLHPAYKWECRNCVYIYNCWLLVCIFFFPLCSEHLTVWWVVSGPFLSSASLPVLPASQPSMWCLSSLIKLTVLPKTPTRKTQPQCQIEYLLLPKPSIYIDVCMCVCVCLKTEIQEEWRLTTIFASHFIQSWQSVEESAKLQGKQWKKTTKTNVEEEKKKDLQ